MACRTRPLDVRWSCAHCGIYLNVPFSMITTIITEKLRNVACFLLNSETIEADIRPNQ